MNRITNYKTLDVPKLKDGPEKLLGTRHDYGAAGQPDMNQTAQTIGFSLTEISELERIYGPGSKGP